MNLLLPGATTKVLGEDLGGFGVGFKAILAGAKWVRVKTAKRRDGKITFLDFNVERDSEGNVTQITVKTSVSENNAKAFCGTLVETARYTDDAEHEISRLSARFEHVGRYVNPDYQVMLGKKQVNAEAVPTLTEMNDVIPDSIDQQIFSCP